MVRTQCHGKGQVDTDEEDLEDVISTTSELSDDEDRIHLPHAKPAGGKEPKPSIEEL